MPPVTAETRERPYALAVLSLGLGALLTAGLLWWASSSPEAVVIGLGGRHDQGKGGTRLASCLDCHVPFVGTPGTRCLSPGCHGELATGSPPREGAAMPIRFHVALRDERCGSCHVEHARRAVLETPLSFSHPMIPERARGECRLCHSGAVAADHSTTDAIDCKRCHDTEGWSGGGIDHARVASEHCDVCHQPPDDPRHENLAGTCSTCHEVGAWAPALVPDQPAAALK